MYACMLLVLVLYMMTCKSRLILIKKIVSIIKIVPIIKIVSIIKTACSQLSHVMNSLLFLWLRFVYLQKTK